MPIVLPSTTRPSITEPTYIAPPIWKRALAWSGVVLGALLVLSAAVAVGDGFRSVVGLALMGLASGVVGGWWMWCERKDKERADEDYQLDLQADMAQRAMSGFVSPGALAPLAWDTPLVPIKRRWALVGSFATALFLGAAVLMPSVEAAPAQVATPPIPATSTVTVPAPVPTTGSAAPTSSPTSSSVEDTTATQAESRPLSPEFSEQDARRYVPPQQVAPATAPDTAPVPAPVYESVPAAASVPQSAYYANCSAARAAGAAPLMRGAPGYSPKLDRDNDGVACE